MRLSRIDAIPRGPLKKNINSRCILFLFVIPGGDAGRSAPEKKRMGPEWGQHQPGAEAKRVAIVRKKFSEESRKNVSDKKKKAGTGTTLKFVKLLNFFVTGKENK